MTLLKDQKYTITQKPLTNSEGDFQAIYNDLFALFNSFRALIYYIDSSLPPNDGQLYGMKDGVWEVIP